jgi:metallo-beta-lactamase class B
MRHRLLRFSFVFAVAAIALRAFAAPVQDDPDGWREPIAPMKLVGPIHYVGTRGLAAYLIATSAGHILIDGGVPVGGPLIVRSIEALGFAPRDVKVLLTTQAHFDHVGSLAHLKQVTGGRVLVMQGDEGLLRSGGATDYLMGPDARYHFPRVEPDEVIVDGRTFTLGDVALTAIRTPGHTPGTTTYTTTVQDGGRTYRVVFAGSTYVNPGTRLVKNPSYPGILDDYRAALRVLEGLRPEVFLAAHGSQFDFEAKRARAASEGPSVWVDPEGFRKGVEASRARLEELAAAESKK